MSNLTNRQIVTLTVIILFVLCALLVYSRAEGASLPPHILYVHDDLHKVGCWLTEQGGIFCMADPSTRDDRPYLALR